MSKRDEYLEILHGLDDWDDYLLANSGLPGPRGNLELAHAVADIAFENDIDRWLLHSADKAPTNDPHEFLAFCGVLGLGRLIGSGATSRIPQLRTVASDPRWRIREAVSQAATIWAETEPSSVIAEMVLWSRGSLLECRAAAASIADLAAAKLLGDDPRSFEVLNNATAKLRDAQPGEDEARTVLQKGLSYCWSVVIAAQPSPGRPAFEKWFDCEEKHVRRMLLENLKKKRLERIDPTWVSSCLSRLSNQ